MNVDRTCEQCMIVCYQEPSHLKLSSVKLISTDVTVYTCLPVWKNQSYRVATIRQLSCSGDVTDKGFSAKSISPIPSWSQAHNKIISTHMVSPLQRDVYHTYCRHPWNKAPLSGILVLSQVTCSSLVSRPEQYCAVPHLWTVAPCTQWKSWHWDGYF